MDVRSPLFQKIACILMGVMFLNPIVSTAAELAVDAAAGGNTSLGNAQNGVPVVNIATPNGSGLSHNKFTDYNVGQQGLILNNGTAAFNETQLGGVILGNSNLNGRAANLILNEVTGGNQSQLKGYTEVAGQGAHVVVANPHGITCDGCGFINTPRATLTTGTPVIDNGKLDHFDVNGGEINIEGAGLNASNISQFDLITRSAKLNAELQAQRLNIIAGRNEVDATTLAATAKADDGSAKPLLAIDSSALGGMYAGAIRLVGTEAGVGVKLAADMAASGGDIHIDANGKLTVARVASAGSVSATAKHIDLTDSVYATQNATLTADQIDIASSLASGANLSLTSAAITNNGSLEAGVKADGSGNSTALLDLQGGTLNNNGSVSSQGRLNTDLQRLNNAGKTILAVGEASVRATTLDNRGGTLVGQQTLTVTADNLDNRAGTLASNKALSLTLADTLNNSADGLLLSKADGLTLTAKTLNNAGGTVQADGSALTMTATDADNSAGTLRGASVVLTAGAVSNQGGSVLAKTELTVNAASFNNSDGTVGANTVGLNLSGHLNNTDGLVESATALQLKASSVSNSGGKLRALGSTATSAFEIGGLFSNDGGLVEVGNATLSLTSASLSNQLGTVRHLGSQFALTLTDAYSGDGSLLSQGDLTVIAARLETGANAVWTVASKADFTVSGVFSNRGAMTAGKGLIARAESLQNYGTLGAAGTLRLEGTSLLNDGGLIFSGQDMTLRLDRFTNRSADVFSLGRLSIAKDDSDNLLSLLENRSGSIESTGDMSLRAAVLTNRKDLFRTENTQIHGWVSVTCFDCSGDHHNVDYIAREVFETSVVEDSAAARISSGGNLDIKGGELANHYSTIAASGAISITATSLENMGATTGTFERVRRYNTGRISDGSDERFRDNYVDPYNAQGFPKVLPAYFGRWTLVSDIETRTPGAIAAPAIVQAGGAVTIQATQPITNASVIAHQAPQLGGAQGTDAVADASRPVVVQLNPQLVPDATQQPVTLPAFNLPQGHNGLFHVNTDSSHPFLVETNPAFASLRGFLSSDYLLNTIGYNQDVTQRRLGDGLYEQRLVQQAIAARTGKRFLDGLSSDEAQFRYLMDNAIASKTALNLVPGIALSAEQVAALTHDIVWMQEQEIDGQKVLVPVLYLAQATDRLAPNGALIQGHDVTLISGATLLNSGTLRASNNLTVSAETIGNGGLMQANERLSMLAADSIHNAQGGVIAGKDVSLAALTGDILNQRTVTTDARRGKGFSQVTSVVDNAASIEAANDLHLSAGGDIVNLGSQLKAGGNAELKAGGDVVIGSAEAQDSQMRKDRRHAWETSSTSQYGSDVQVGGDLQIKAGNDLAVIASEMKAGGGIALQAGHDVTLSAAANESSSEYRYKGNGKKVTKETGTVRQQASVIEAGGDLGVSADNNLIISASELTAGKEAYLYAGEQLAVISAEDSDYSLSDKSKKGSWGRKSAKRDEVTDVRNVGSAITTGGDLTLESGGDQLYRKATLDSAGDLSLDSGGAITFEAVADSHSESHEKSSNSWVWTSLDNKGRVDETLRQSQLSAKGEVLIEAVKGLHIDVKQINKETVSQSIDAMVQADPSMAWLKDVEARGDVDWRQVKELDDKWHDSHSGLGGPATIVIIIIVAYFTAGAASGLIGTLAGGAGGGAFAAGTAATVAADATAAGWANVAGSAMLTSAAGTATVSTINNKGNLAAAAKETFSSNSLKNYAVAGITAGLTAGIFNDWTGTTTGPAPALTDATNGALANTGAVGVANASGGLSSLQGVGQFAANQMLQNSTSAVLNKMLGREGSLGDALQASLANTFAAAGFNLIGDLTSATNWDLKDGSPTKIALHAVMGGLAAEAAGGSFKTGALAAGVNEAVVDALANQYGQMDPDHKKALLVMNSQLIGVMTATVQGGDEQDLQTGSWVAKNATEYNLMAHWDEFEERYDGCRKDPSASGCSTVLKVGGVTSQSLGNVALNKDAEGNIVSYTLLDESGKPWMIMEPAEYQMFVSSPSGIQEGYKTAPQWQLNLSSSLLYAHQGDTAKALENYVFMLTDPGYQQEMLLGLTLGLVGGLAGGVKGLSGTTFTDKLVPKLIHEDPRNLIPVQTKSEMSGSQIKRLAKDMEKNGFDPSKPVDAWRNPSTGRLEIQDGHHRTEAAKKAGLDKIPVEVWE